MERERYEDVVDATRRTRLASERTYLAWWRSALAAFAVSLGVGKLVPELTIAAGRSATRSSGSATRCSGSRSSAYGYRRQQVLERALAEGRFVPFERWAAFGFTAAGVVLGVATLVVIVA